jgi:hypothetical protein
VDEKANMLRCSFTHRDELLKLLERRSRMLVAIYEEQAKWNE